MIRHLNTLFLLGAITSCTNTSIQNVTPELDSDRAPNLLAPDLYAEDAPPEKELVVRYGRYTLPSTVPNIDQRDLMTQIIDINIPRGMKPNVGDALRYVMTRSGYSLCSVEAGQAQNLFNQPLPASHYKIGPLRLGDALQIMAGQAWQVEVDESSRWVCVVKRPSYKSPRS